jgi:hypothetical protein
MSKNAVTTFVAFLMPDPAMPLAGIPIPMAVANRCIDSLDIPANACGFYFYDLRPAHGQNEQPAPVNVSPVYLIADNVLTRDAAKDMLIGHGEWRKGRLKNTFSFDIQIEANDFFIVSPQQKLLALRPDHIVINRKREQIHPLPAAPRAQKAPHNFDPRLQKAVRPPVLRFKRKPDGPAG